ncbi:MAG: DNA internalization-related competence protein ComEC/Rec2 [Desulfobacula sp.]|uniref:DNA internalization-related competence protein ComEC/Rec2 n=1 Tax=Desulfobacula sp. TaxID=2593537 RepID=UPI0025C519E1|nr:DNA internalization-related competence protein ComEC/Rec2 [Desulfobacula sp.]MCD4720287.1 DNA internalization-related competence protein ComEC/Rec2 [Desulfobacula sp.]
MKTFFKPLNPASLFIFFSMMAGILAGNLSSDYKTLAFWAFLALFVLVCLTFYLNKKIVLIFILGLVFNFGYLSIQVKLFPDLPSHHISNYLDSEKFKITGSIVSFTKHYEKKFKLILLCHTIETKDGKKEKVTGRINLNLYRFPKVVPQFGDIIMFKSSIRSVRNFMNPGAFDYKSFLKLRQIYGTAYSDARKIKILTDPDQIGFISGQIRKIEKVRTDYYHFILNHTKHSTAGKIMASLITGKKQVISPDMRDLFSKAGISHLLAISGLHLSIVSLLFFYLFYWFLSFMPALLIAARSKKIAGILTIVPLVFYAVFSGFSPSTQRALIMIIVLLISFVSEKEKDILSSLSIAGILILIIDPAALFSISFQLSFIAVIFIIYGVSQMQNWVQNLSQNLFKKGSFIAKKNLFSKVLMMMSVTFFAGLGTLPLTAHYFNIVSTIALISNLIAIPVLGFIVLPAGLISLVCFPYFPLFATFIINVCTKLISVLITLSEFLVSIPYSWSRTITLQWSEIAAIYLVFIAIFFILKGIRKTPVFLLFLSVLLILFNFSNTRLDKTLKPNLSITIIDVGQGNSALIQTPEGKRILVDGGGFSDSSSFDTGRFIIAPFLWQKRIRSLDTVILSHPESDHLNGLIFILQNFNVHTLIKNADMRNSRNYTALIKACEDRDIRILNPLSDGNLLDFGTTRLLFYDSLKNSFSYDFNNNSLVFKVIYNDFSMLFPGDILSLREKNLSSLNNPDLHSDILLSPHHGSSTSSTKFFLDKVQPKSVIISCGWHNRYGFPHTKVLKRYNKMGISIFRTDEDGAIFISSDGKNHNIRTHKGR